MIALRKHKIVRIATVLASVSLVATYVACRATGRGGGGSASGPSNSAPAADASPKSGEREEVMFSTKSGRLFPPSEPAKKNPTFMPSSKLMVLEPELPWSPAAPAEPEEDPVPKAPATSPEKPKEPKEPQKPEEPKQDEPKPAEPKPPAAAAAHVE